jgi:hypothetical protein
MLDRSQVLRVAAAAEVDPRTVDRVVNKGTPPRSPAVLEALARALEAEGFAELAVQVRGLR